ncbi:MAG: Fic family protein [Candidatus Woesearchaeota archaeon]
MPHKYDLFLQLAQGNSSPVIKNRPYFEKQLLQENVISKNNQKTVILQTEKSKQLLSILMFCLNNNLDYTFYTKDTTITYLSNFFNNQKTPISVNTQTQIRKRLQKDTFLLYFSQKPLDFLILPHTFFKELLDYFDKKYSSLNLPKNKIDNKVSNTKINKNNPEISSFIHTSLQLEGNLLTLRQTQQVLQNKILEKEVQVKDILETTNYKQAIERIKQIEKISLEDLLQIHKTIMQHETHAGMLRNESVHIAGNPEFKILEHENIEKELQKLLHEINTHTKKNVIDLCKNAAYIHNQLQFIHPFIDGNSRTTRLITQWYFNKHNIAFDIPISCTTLYVEQTKGYKKRSDEKLATIFEVILIQLSNTRD